MQPYGAYGGMYGAPPQRYAPQMGQQPQRPQTQQRPQPPKPQMQQRPQQQQQKQQQQQQQQQQVARRNPPGPSLQLDTSAQARHSGTPKSPYSPSASVAHPGQGSSYGSSLMLGSRERELATSAAPGSQRERMQTHDIPQQPLGGGGSGSSGRGFGMMNPTTALQYSHCLPLPQRQAPPSPPTSNGGTNAQGHPEQSSSARRSNHLPFNIGGSSFGENLRHNPTSPSTPPPPAISNSSSAAVLADMHRRDKEAETGERPNGERLKEDIVVQKWLREKERLGLEPERAQLAVEAAKASILAAAAASGGREREPNSAALLSKELERAKMLEFEAERVRTLATRNASALSTGEERIGKASTGDNSISAIARSSDSRPVSYTRLDQSQASNVHTSSRDTALSESSLKSPSVDQSREVDLVAQRAYDSSFSNTDVIALADKSQNGAIAGRMAMDNKTRESNSNPIDTGVAQTSNDRIQGNDKLPLLYLTERIAIMEHPSQSQLGFEIFERVRSVHRTFAVFNLSSKLIYASKAISGGAVAGLHNVACDRLALRALVRVVEAVKVFLDAQPSALVLMHGDSSCDALPVVCGALLLLLGKVKSAHEAISATSALLSSDSSLLLLFGRMSAAGRRYLEYLQGLNSALSPKFLRVTDLPLSRVMNLNCISLVNTSELLLPSGADLFVVVHNMGSSYASPCLSDNTEGNDKSGSVTFEFKPPLMVQGELLVQLLMCHSHRDSAPTNEVLLSVAFDTAFNEANLTFTSADLDVHASDVVNKGHRPGLVLTVQLASIGAHASRLADVGLLSANSHPGGKGGVGVAGVGSTPESYSIASSQPSERSGETTMKPEAGESASSVPSVLKTEASTERDKHSSEVAMANDTKAGGGMTDKVVAKASPKPVRSVSLNVPDDAPVLDARKEPLTRVAQVGLGITFYKSDGRTGLVVKRIKDFSCGLEPGDRVLSIDGDSLEAGLTTQQLARLVLGPVGSVAHLQVRKPPPLSTVNTLVVERKELTDLPLDSSVDSPHTPSSAVGSNARRSSAERERERLWRQRQHKLKRHGSLVAEKLAEWHSERGRSMATSGLFSGSVTPLGGSLSGSIERYTAGLSGSIESDIRSLESDPSLQMSSSTGLSSYLEKYEQEVAGTGSSASLFKDLSMGLGGSMDEGLESLQRFGSELSNHSPRFPIGSSAELSSKSSISGTGSGSDDMFDTLYAKLQRERDPAGRTFVL